MGCVPELGRRVVWRAIALRDGDVPGVELREACEVVVSAPEENKVISSDSLEKIL